MMQRESYDTEICLEGLYSPKKIIRLILHIKAYEGL